MQAGFAEVWAIGIRIKSITSPASPIAKFGSLPARAYVSRMRVITNSIANPDIIETSPGRMSSLKLDAKPPARNTLLRLAAREQAAHPGFRIPHIVPTRRGQAPAPALTWISTRRKRGLR